MEIQVVSHDAGDSLRVCGGPRAAHVDVVADFSQFVRDAVRDVSARNAAIGDSKLNLCFSCLTRLLLWSRLRSRRPHRILQP